MDLINEKKYPARNIMGMMVRTPRTGDRIPRILFGEYDGKYVRGDVFDANAVAAICYKEECERKEEDAKLHARIDQEISDRVAGDNNLQAQINTIGNTITGLNSRISALEAKI